MQKQYVEKNTGHLYCFHRNERGQVGAKHCLLNALDEFTSVFWQLLVCCIQLCVYLMPFVHLCKTKHGIPPQSVITLLSRSVM